MYGWCRNMHASLCTSCRVYQGHIECPRHLGSSAPLAVPSEENIREPTACISDTSPVCAPSKNNKQASAGKVSINKYNNSCSNNGRGTSEDTASVQSPPPTYDGNYSQFEEWKHRFTADTGLINAAFPRLIASGWIDRLSQKQEQSLSCHYWLWRSGARNGLVRTRMRKNFCSTCAVLWKTIRLLLPGMVSMLGLRAIRA